jgi:hypothetical protein
MSLCHEMIRIELLVPDTRICLLLCRSLVCILLRLPLAPKRKPESDMFQINICARKMLGPWSRGIHIVSFDSEWGRYARTGCKVGLPATA